MLTELSKVVIEFCKLLKDKCRKKTPEEKLRQMEKQKMSQEQKMAKYWKGCKVWRSKAGKLN